MHKVEPQVFKIAESIVHRPQLDDYLESIGAEQWKSDADTDIEELVEVMGRGCYKSFGTELNKNITRTRESSVDYLANILKSGHGSVLEHSWVSFQFVNVSRVFTHELVRHRVGVAISQESLRFVRLDNLGLWVPPAFSDIPEAVNIMENQWWAAEHAYAGLLRAAATKEGKEFDKLPFDVKKYYTSAARRVAPLGLATSIGWSCNMRTLRAVIEQRTSRHAEEEIRLVFGRVGEIAQTEWPNLFGDYMVEMVKGLPEFTTEHRKI